MTEPQIYEALTAIFGDVFLRDDLVLSDGLSARDVPDWDSFKQIEILIAAETRFGLKFTTREMDSLDRVGDLVRLIAGKTR
jgi:acyl carrier protein